MKKRSSTIFFWLCCFAAVLGLYVTPFTLMLADDLLGTHWYENHASEPLKLALAYLYYPVHYLIEYFFG